MRLFVFLFALSLQAQPLFFRGVSFTAERGVRYESPEAIDQLDQLTKYSVDSVALIPFAFTPRGETKIVFGNDRSWESDAGITVAARAAHERKMKVVLKPQIWPNKPIDLKDAVTRKAWFANYQTMVVHYAKLAATINADLFCIGTELQYATVHEPEFRRLIQTARANFKGPLTYAEFERITFWNALDYIGLDNYYPLPDTLDTKPLATKLEALHKKYRKPIIFTEAGYAAAPNSHRTPWEDRSERPVHLEAQAKAYDALLSAFYLKPWFAGVFWWKLGTNGFGGPQDNTMTPWNKPAMNIIKRWYQTRRATTPTNPRPSK